MKDNYGREITYLRISITDECNLRCLYCMPEDEGCLAKDSSLMSADEIVEITAEAVKLGISKVRITGGEPLIRPDVIDICRRISSLPGVKELAVTTNGMLLKDLAYPLKEAGVSRLNISLDTLQTEKYTKITRKGNFQDVAEGIRLAAKAGLTPIKINTVLIGGFNDCEIRDFGELTRTDNVEVRFIELMPIGACAAFPKHAFVKGDIVLREIPELVEAENSGVARMYQYPDGCGRIGIISAVNQHFCLSCNRIRLTCDGKIKPCLHSKEEVLVKGLHGEELKKALIGAITNKPAEHVNLTYGYVSETERYMNQIGG
ncbi:Probable molybdopterin cofactor synthesis protein A [uncultured Roseburia sp.]|uniref:GTP 3',8-cyclase n=1 Tax=Brotonthovivens ammoniilytica TaxID=2981725 RepID=A0ABT2TEW2_9FIRM|nr:GTP 3',8-cyclase MoaA [Brotonthovivens ammoniilytica]MCU6760729.1 GTP 3',8-cyclase MoaA [Brotonthovivens ammoniilytica]SCI07360.1 Probable molybdopterin cofactor synthesis protein A [uncultured Roseburia sp.]